VLRDAEASARPTPISDGRNRAASSKPPRSVSAEHDGAKDIGRVDVSEASISTGIAQRYATAVFELAKEGKALAALEKDLDALETAMNVSADLAAMISSPVYSREDMAKAMAALSVKMNLSPALAGALGVMAAKRRLFVLPQLLASLRTQISEDKGEVTADVVAAKSMTKAQHDKLAKALKATVGKDVKINLAVDESLIGGLVVKVGSKMIDSSIRSRLNALQNSMKEVG
jgi:F-type H+-transporting ATPase subunit delta